MKFLEAIKMGKSLKEIEELDDRGELEDLDFQEKDTGKTALHYAIERGEENIINFLLQEAWIKVGLCNNEGRSALTWAVANNKQNIIKLLLSNEKFVKKALERPDNNRQTALHVAVATGNIEIFSLLVAKGANPNVSIEGGLTPLMSAIFHKQYEMIDFLIIQPDILKEINKQTKGGATALSLILSGRGEGQNLKVFLSLLKLKNIDIVVANQDGLTPLMYATLYNQKEALRILLSKLANVNSQSKSGDTALLLACQDPRKLDLETIALLIQNAADPLVKNKAGFSFMDLLDPDSKLKDLLEKEKIAEILLKHAIKSINAKVIFALKEKPIYKEIYERLSVEEKEKLKQILTIKPKNVEFVTDRMLEFSGGFGNVSYEGGLLTVSEVNNRKKMGQNGYLFNPTVLKGEKEFSEYLQCIKRSEKIPLRERFVISGIHWICGDILIDKDKNVQILFIDSLGIDSLIITRKPISAAQKIFPEATMYLDQTPRQNAGAGCSIYALDDVRHLFTIERYLEPKYQETGLFGYLSEHQKGEIPIAGGRPIKNSDLPLPFMRTLQSSLLYKDKVVIKQESGKEVTERAIILNRNLEEQLLPLGKNKESGQALQARLLIEGFKRKSGTRTRMNEILQEKLEKMCKYNFNYLLNFESREALDKAIHTFSLEGFKERIQPLKKHPEKP